MGKQTEKKKYFEYKMTYDAAIEVMSWKEFFCFRGYEKLSFKT